jgi:negative regulator of sigma E activity
MSDERLIEDVARQMTEGQPSADFRARVIAALDNPPRRTTRSAWLLAPVAATALAFIAVVVFRDDHEAARRPDPAGPRASTAIAQTAPPAGSARRPDSAVLSAEASPNGPVPRRARQPESTDAAADLNALAPPPLEMPTLEITSITAESIPVAPMETIAPIPVTPLPTSDERPSTYDY